MPIYYRRVRILAISRMAGTTDRLRIVIWAGAHGIFTRMLKIQFLAIHLRAISLSSLNSARREDDAENALSLRPQSRPDCVRPVLARKCFAREKQSPSGRHQKEATQTPSCAA
jgi:hypothetical protein